MQIIDPDHSDTVDNLDGVEECPAKNIIHVRIFWDKDESVVEIYDLNCLSDRQTLYLNQELYPIQILPKPYTQAKEN